MLMKMTTASAFALCLVAAGALAAQAPVTKTKSVTGTATIQAIESSTRAITLRDETGTEETYVAGPEVKRFDELKVGDTVKMTYYESVFLQVRKPGVVPAGTTGDKLSGTAIDGGITRGEGALPGVSAGVQEKMTV